MQLWCLDTRFDYKLVSFADDLLVYHGSSGMTHWLKGASAIVFKWFYTHPTGKYGEEEIAQQLGITLDLDSLLNELQQKYLVMKVAEK